DRDRVKAKRDRHRRPHKRLRTDAEKAAAAERTAAEAGALTRRAAPGQWAALGAEPDSYFDSRGDRDNLVFQALYRANIAAYHRVDPTGVAAGARPRYGLVYGPRGVGEEADGASQRGTAGERRRYFLASVVRAERDRRACRVRLGRPRRSPPLVKPAAAPVGDGGNGAEAAEGEGVGESHEMYLLRRTRELNAAVRERPFDLQLWLDFAAFQDDAAQPAGMRVRPGVAAAAAEKKIAILEQALAHHPGSDELLLALLGAAEVAAPADEVLQRWRRVLSRHGGSGHLWRAFLAWRRGGSSGGGTAAVTALRHDYADALMALAREQARRRRDGAPADVVAEVEREWTDMLCDAVRLELQAGHTEQGVARIQAALEYACLPKPALPSGPAAKLRAFQACWEAGAPLLGEPRARGWGAWHQRRLAGLPAEDEGDRAGAAPAAPAEPDPEEEEEEGGWGGWVPLAPAMAVTGEGAAAEGAGADNADPDSGDGSLADDRGGDGDADAEAEPPPEAEEGTEEELLARLGVRLEAEVAALAGSEGGGFNDDIARRWGAQEQARDSAQFLPLRVRPAPGEEAGAEDAGAAATSAEDRLVEFDEVRECLLTLDEPAAQRRLALQLLELLGAPLGAWRCSNAAARDTDAAVALGPELAGALAALAGDGVNPNPDPNRGADSNGKALGAAGGSRAGAAWLSPEGFYGRLDGPAGGAPAADGSGAAVPVSEARPAAAAPGAACAGAQPPPPAAPAWFQASEERRGFLARALEALLDATFPDDARLAGVLLAVEAAPVVDLDRGGPAPDQSPDWARAGGAAQRLLGARRDNLALWGAYAALQARAGQLKAARKVYDTALSALATNAAARTRHAAPLALAAAEAELRRIAGAAADRYPDSAPTGVAAGVPRALHLLAWLGSGGPYERMRTGAKGAPAELPDAARLLEARRGFQAMLSARLGEGGSPSTADAYPAAACEGLPPSTVAVVAAAALFERLLPAAGAKLGGWGAAAAVYEQALAAAPLSSAAHEELAERHCALLAEAAAAGAPGFTPGRVHCALHAALEVYPHSPALLGALASAELRARTGARLRRALAAAAAAAPGVATALLALRCEAALPAAGHRVQALLERAVATPATRGSPLLWRVYIAHELAAGRPDAARRVFLRGVHACAWAKALWLDGLVRARGALVPRERAELLEVARERGVRVRTDVYEALLAAVDPAALLGAD
ncbi:hypothetical protein WJX81_005554, partial [Elliptochloris bilobata]